MSSTTAAGPLTTGAPTHGSGVRARWSRWRWPIGVGALLLVGALAGLLLLRPTSGERLSPNNPAPDGGRAVAQVLDDQGVDVRVRDRFDAVRSDLGSGGGPVTVLVARPDLLAPGRAAELRRLVAGGVADLVLVAAGNDVLTDLELAVGAGSAVETKMREPGCADPVAGRAGQALLGGTGYRPTEVGGQATVARRGCYQTPDGAATYLAVDRVDGRRTTLLGDGAFLTNDRLADSGDAALALGVLGQHPVLVWWTPSPLDGPPSTAPPSAADLLPDGVRYAAWQLAVVVLVVAFWRGRRLGRLATEPLPVVVRAVETTRGRAQLYRRARARGRAAQVLRAAATRRLATRCGLPRTASPAAVSVAVSSTTGRPAPEVADLLVGVDPADDVALVLIARDLETLEEEVRRS